MWKMRVTYEIWDKVTGSKRKSLPSNATSSSSTAHKSKGPNRHLRSQRVHISKCTRVIESSGRFGKETKTMLGVLQGHAQDYVSAVLGSWTLLSWALQLQSVLQWSGKHSSCAQARRMGAMPV